MTTTMLIYNKIIPLNREQHRDLCIRPGAEKAGFSRATHFVPLAGAEFIQTARDMPIFFAKDAGGGPIALLGLRENENLFIEQDGAWRGGVYAPAFIRRYPFVLATGDDQDQVTVCIDETFSGFVPADAKAKKDTKAAAATEAGAEAVEKQRLFDEEGKETEYLSSMIDFLNRFSADMLATRDFMEKLAELDLLITRSLRVEGPGGRTYQLNDFRIVDEQKLAGLDDKVLVELHRKGWLGWIYAHLISLGNVNGLSIRVPLDK